MAQVKSNQVTWGINTKPSLAAPSLRTKTTTPQTTLGQAKGGMNGMAFPSLTALGVKPQSNQIPFPNPPLTSNNRNPSTAFNPASPTPGSSMSGSLDAIKAQAMGVQSLLDQRRAAEQAPRPVSPTTQNDSRLAGILKSLLGASRPTAEQERTRKEMERIAAGNKAIGEDARRTSAMYADEIKRVGELGAGAVAGNLSTGTNVVGSGNAAIASQSASQRMQALGTAQKAALEGTAQQLTGQQQTAQAFQPSLDAALVQQQQQLGGLGTAGGLAQPVQVPYSNQFIDPATGQSAGGAGLGGYAGYNAAQQSIELAGQYPDAGVQYDPSQTPEQNLQRIQQAIQSSPSYQRGAYGVAGADSYLGAQQLGAAGNLTQTVAPLQALGGAADANFNLMLDIMERGGINDVNIPVINQLSQRVQRGLASNQDVVAFRSALQTVRSQYASILGGGTPTDATQAMAAEKIPDTVSLGALQEVERTMRSMVSNTVASYNQQIGAYSGQGGGGGSSFAEQW